MLLNCVILAIQVEPDFDEDSGFGFVPHVLDWVLAMLFVLEVLLQAIAVNFIFGEGALLRCYLRAESALELSCVS